MKVRSLVSQFDIIERNERFDDHCFMRNGGCCFCFFLFLWIEYGVFIKEHDFFQAGKNADSRNCANCSCEEDNYPINNTTRKAIIYEESDSCDNEEGEINFSNFTISENESIIFNMFIF